MPHGAYSNALLLLQRLRCPKVWSLSYDRTNVRGLGETIPECQFPEVRRRPSKGCRGAVSGHRHVSVAVFFNRWNRVHAWFTCQAHLRFLERNCGSRQDSRREQTVSCQASIRRDRYLNRRTMFRALEDALRRHSSGGASGSGGFPGKGHTLADGNSTAGTGAGGRGVAAFQALDPQVKVLMFLLGGYLVFWYLS